MVKCLHLKWLKVVINTLKIMTHLERFQFSDLLSLVGKHHLVLILDGRQQGLVCLKILDQILKHLAMGLKPMVDMLIILNYSNDNLLTTLHKSTCI